MQKKEKKNSYKNNDVMAEPNNVSNLYSNGFLKDEEKVESKNVSGDSIQLQSEDAKVLRNNEQTVLQHKLRIADIELTIANLNKEKASLVDLVRAEHDQFVANARQFAVKNGIDPDGEPTGDKWNLDTSTMVFHKLK